MKKEGTKFGLFWLGSALVFHALIFLPPKDLFGVDRYAKPGFWLAYGMVLTVLLLILPFGFPVLRADRGEVFLGIRLRKLAYPVTVLAAASGAVFLLLPFLPAWIGSLLSAVGLILLAAGALKVCSAEETAPPENRRPRILPAKLRALIARAEDRMIGADDPASRANAKHVWEALRYATPISDPTLWQIEEDICLAFDVWEEATGSDDPAAQQAAADRLLTAIALRDQLCARLQ